MKNLFGFVFCFSLLFFHQAESWLQQANKKNATIFVFGDSVFDAGNNNFLNISEGYKANYPPYGETFFKNPTGRFSDGRLIPDYIASFANLPYWKPYLAGNQSFVNGANFASAGSCTLSSCDHLTLNFEIQVSFFKDVASLLREQLGEAEAKKLLMNAVFFSSTGGVDYWIFLGEYPNATTSQKQDYVDAVIGNLTEGIKEIYELGGRKFAFQNIAAMGCQPTAKQTYNLSADECYQPIEDLEMLHNHALVTAVTELEIALPGSKHIIFDYYSLLKDLTFNPTKYGIKEANYACCGNGSYRGEDCGVGDYYLCSNPNDFVYFDGDHVTDHGNFILAELLWNGGQNITGPLNMKQLVEYEPDEMKNFSEYDGASADE